MARGRAMALRSLPGVGDGLPAQPADHHDVGAGAGRLVSGLRPRAAQFGRRVNTHSKGPAPDARYERLNPGAKAQRRPIAALPLLLVKDYCREVIAEQYAAGLFAERSAAEAFTDVMAMALHHGAYREGLGSLTGRFGVSKETLVRGSKHLRTPLPGQQHGLIWRTRGTRETGVTVWRAGHPLVKRIAAVRERRNAIRDAVVRRKHQRDEVRRLAAEHGNVLAPNDSGGKGVTTRLVAAPGAAGGTGGSLPGQGSRPDGASCPQDPLLKLSRCPFCRNGKQHPDDN